MFRREDWLSAPPWWCHHSRHYLVEKDWIPWNWLGLRRCITRQGWWASRGPWVGLGVRLDSPAATKAAIRHVSFHRWLQEPFMSCLCFSVCASQLFLLATWLFLRARRHSSAQNPSLQVTPQPARLFSLTSPLPAANLFSFSECRLPFSMAFWSRVHYGMSCVVRVLHKMNLYVLFCSVPLKNADCGHSLRNTALRLVCAGGLDRGASGFSAPLYSALLYL